MAKFTRMAPAKAGADERSRSGHKRRRNHRRNRRSNT